jgi:Uncharacterized conserved protein
MGEHSGGYRPFPSFAAWADEGLDGPALTTYERFAALLAEAKQTATREDLQAAVRTATRYAAVDTGAIEGLYDVDRGFTRTVATEAAAWEVAVELRGEHVARAIDDALNAYEFVLDLATRRERITEAVIRELHAVICRSQDTYTVYTSQGRQEHPLPKGEYKKYPNSPTNLSTGRVHHYAPVSDTSAEMHRLVGELASGRFNSAHPVVQAAYAHYAFVCVHPFADGNGRVARALASAFLYRSPGVPLLVFADQKDAYIDVLEAADQGEHQLFTQFVLERVIDAVQLVRASLPSEPVPALVATVETYRRQRIGRAGLVHREVDALNARLLSLVHDEIAKRLSESDLGGLQTGVYWSNGTVDFPPPQGYRPRQTDQDVLGLRVDTGAPVKVGSQNIYSSFVALPSHDGADFVVVERDRPERCLEVFLREISPTVTHVLELKIAAWVDLSISRLVRWVVDAEAKALQRLGYVE